MKPILLLLTLFLLFTTLNALSVNIFIQTTPSLQVTSPSSSFTITAGTSKTTINETTLNITPTSNAIVVNNQRFPSNITISAPQAIAIDNIHYRGQIKLSITPLSGLMVINHIDLEAYVAGVVAAEMGGYAPLEAQKAQAVATRTITISKILTHKHQKDGYDLCNTTHCQVYRGLSGQTEISQKAVAQTENQIMLYNGKPIEAFYSSHCGGITEYSGNLWATQHDYLTINIDSYCIDSTIVPEWNQKNIFWEREFTKTELETLLGVRNISEMYITKRNNSSRITEIFVRAASRTLTISGQYEIRNKFDLPSSLFFLFSEGNLYRFLGNGYGHGVGMCQTGAIARATIGQTYTEILNFYYTGITIDDKW